jgi:hypothetical protein
MKSEKAEDETEERMSESEKLKREGFELNKQSLEKRTAFVHGESH